MLSRTTRQEREFEKAFILKQRERYLHADVIRKVQQDEGYRAKIQQLESAVTGEEGWILDIGSNTCGECEYLVSQGYKVIATDINECALMISAERVKRSGRRAPWYVACDGQRLPFRSGSVGCIVFNESLHHMPSPGLALSEVHRVLKAGGTAVLYEPCAYDPLRRISAWRDYFAGTIEKSFSPAGLAKLIREAGLDVLGVQPPTLAPSTWKLEQLSLFRRWLRVRYYRLRRALPRIFGALFVVARKTRNQNGTIA